jgi:hypothetical protein
LRTAPGHLGVTAGDLSAVQVDSRTLHGNRHLAEYAEI